MNKTLKGGTLLLSVALLGACAGQPAQRKDMSCEQTIDRAYQELSFAESKGVSGTVSWTKAASLLTAAKVQQQLEQYDQCLDKAEKARFYIKQSQAK